MSDWGSVSEHNPCPQSHRQCAEGKPAMEGTSTPLQGSLSAGQLGSSGGSPMVFDLESFKRNGLMDRTGCCQVWG